MALKYFAGADIEANVHLGTVDPPGCEDGPICDREFAPTKTGNVCIRDGHGVRCHEPFGITLRRVCFWKRDDKTVETCGEKFDNAGMFKDEPRLPPRPNWPLVGPEEARRFAEESWRRRAISANASRELSHLYEAIRRTAANDVATCYRLARIELRPGEWKRLIGWDARYPDEDMPRMDPGQVGSMWVDTIGMTPVFDNAVLPERVGGRRLLAALFFKATPQLWASRPFREQAFMSGFPIMRLITED